MILGAYSLLLENPSPSREEIIRHMDDHLCRCGAHKQILEAIEAASKAMSGAKA